MKSVADFLIGLADAGDEPAGLSKRVGDVDMGEPEAVAPALLEELGRVMTDPGRIPQLEVKVGDGKLALPLKHTHVSAELSGFVARVEVTQTYQNPLSNPIEAIYVFPLPENSAVDDMKIRIGERLIEADIQRRAEARATYEQAKRAGHTAALLEQERPNVFTQSIANMEPGKDIEVIIRYVQNLSYDSGEYEFVFPMVVGPRFFPPGKETGSRSGTGWAKDTDAVSDASRVSPPIIGGGRRTGHDISLELVLTEGLGVKDFRVPTHEVKASQVDDALVIELASQSEIPNRDFVLRYAVDGDDPHGALYAHRSKKGGFFSLVLQPPELDVDKLVGKRELIFVIDISGSMYGRPLSMAKDAAKLAIRRLRPVDTFNVITFAGATAKAFPSPREGNSTNIRDGIDFIMKAQAGGGTMLGDAVAEALKTDVEDGRNRYVVFLTDGYVGNEAEIHRLTRKFVKELGKKGQKARAFGFGIGSSVNRHLLDGIGKAGNGTTVYLTNREAPAEAVRKAFRLIDKPIMENVKIDWKGLEVDDIFPAVMPDLLASRPLILHGRYKDAGAASIVVTGRADGRKVRLEIPVDLPEAEERNGVLETLWARSRIESLERALWDGGGSEVIETITSLGLEFRLVTAYTSFVAVDRSKKVGDGDPTTIVQPVEAPEGVDPSMAAPQKAMMMPMTASRPRGLAEGGSIGYGGLGATGKGRGGGGFAVAHGRKTRTVAIADLRPTLDDAEVDEDEAKADERPKSESALRPRVQVRVHDVEGGLDEKVILRVLMRRRPALISTCESRVVETGAKLAGKLEIRLELSSEGKVVNVNVSKESLGDDELVKRLLAVFKTLRFPHGAGSTKLRVVISLR